jgi:hypothetical protein
MNYKCLDDHGANTCEGSVELREPLSGTGRSFPRCVRHWDLRLDMQEKHKCRYPDSPNPPKWFDPTYAGETWDDGV